MSEDWKGEMRHDSAWILALLPGIGRARELWQA